MIRIYSPEILLLLLCVFHMVASSSIDSKLDFGEAPRNSERLVQYDPKNTAVKVNFPVRSNTDSARKEEQIEADIVVEVKTRVNVKEPQKNTTEISITSEVPIVVGTAGVKTHSVITGNLPNSINQQPLFVANIDQVQPVGPIYPLPQAGLPLLTAGYPNVLNQFNDGINDSGREFKAVTYNLNDLSKVQIPYFEPSYHSHYYGEQQPQRPTIGWYPGNKAAWQPSHWPKTTHTHKTTNDGTTCTCHHQQQQPGSTRGGKNRGFLKIDDKLGRLD